MYCQIRVVSPFVLPLLILRVRLRVRTPYEAMSKMELFVKRKLGQTSTTEMYCIKIVSILLKNIYTFVKVLNNNWFTCLLTDNKHSCCSHYNKTQRRTSDRMYLPGWDAKKRTENKVRMVIIHLISSIHGHHLFTNGTFSFTINKIKSQIQYDSPKHSYNSTRMHMLVRNSTGRTLIYLAMRGWPFDDARSLYTILFASVFAVNN